MRLRRFVGTGAGDDVDRGAWLRRCIQEYREPISFNVPDVVPLPRSLADKLSELVESREAFVRGDMDGTAAPGSGEAQTAAVRAAVAAVVAKVKQVAAMAAVSDSSDSGLNSEVVHENEQEEEAEEEAEEEEQKQSAFSREDEQHNPWPTAILASPPRPTTGGRDAGTITRPSSGNPPGAEEESPIYPLAEYISRALTDAERAASFAGDGGGGDASNNSSNIPQQLPFPPNLCLTDNFFRPPQRWAGVGERRLKNIIFILEWVPPSGPNNTAAAAPDDSSVGELAKEGGPPSRYLLVLSLAEGETVRRLIHTDHAALRTAGLALRYSEAGSFDDAPLDRSSGFVPLPLPPSRAAAGAAAAGSATAMSVTGRQAPCALGCGSSSLVPCAPYPYLPPSSFSTRWWLWCALMRVLCRGDGIGASARGLGRWVAVLALL